jgi:coenzyme F420-reducing hydrogenase gamma subunit
MTEQPQEKPKKKKPIVAVYSLSCCEGCQVAIINQGAKFVELFDYIDLGDMMLVEEQKDVPHYDVAFIEGTPLTKENIEHIKHIREKSTYVLTLGNCATHGNYQGIKNYRDKEAAMKSVYEKPRGIDNFEIKSIDQYIKVDFYLYQCPLNAEEFLRFVYALVNGKAPHIRQRPVCYECQINGTDCLLHKGQMCLGPMVLGGCNAPCPSDGHYRCEACRTVLQGAPVLNMERKLFSGIATKEHLEETLEKFSMKEEWKKARAKEEERIAKMAPKPVVPPSTTPATK